MGAIGLSDSGPRHLICEPARMVANRCPPWFIGDLSSGATT